MEQFKNIFTTDNEVILVLSKEEAERIEDICNSAYIYKSSLEGLYAERIMRDSSRLFSKLVEARKSLTIK